MDYSHPFFSSDDITIPIPNPNQHPSAPLQVLRRESYSTLNDAMANSLIGISNPPQGQIISPIDDSEDMDTSSRPRLTQDQIAILEAEFKGKPKPGTEFKKRLASRIGLSLQRVNVSPGCMLCRECRLITFLRTGIKTDVPKLGTKDHRREGSTFCHLIRMIRMHNGLRQTCRL